MKQAALQAAQDSLAARLRDLFGPDLAGVTGFGAGLDRQTWQPALKVSVDSSKAARRAADLPSSIDGVPVTVEQIGPARGGSR